MGTTNYHRKGCQKPRFVDENRDNSSRWENDESDRGIDQTNTGIWSAVGYWARTRDKASHDPIPIPLGYHGSQSLRTRSTAYIFHTLRLIPVAVNSKQNNSHVVTPHMGIIYHQTGRLGIASQDIGDVYV
ncbi:hypothetical protein TNCV_3527421 [Trichonephila clavipes]|nr:hypothetical protein TNCV_3527421 [Trichonephila clavipes]